MIKFIFSIQYIYKTIVPELSLYRDIMSIDDPKKLFYFPYEKELSESIEKKVEI